MSKCVSVYIAQSIDGYISDRNEGLDWLNSIPNPDGVDMGYTDFIKRIDAIVMGRTTFETVCSFDVDWPYDKPVFVLSNLLKEVPDEYKKLAEIYKGPLKLLIKELNNRGYKRLYIDGGKTIQSFLKEDLVDELIVTTLPILLGGGSTLFANLPTQMIFEHVGTEVFLNAIVQTHYKRKRH